MATTGRQEEGERRAYRRVPAEFRVHCRRLGLAGVDDTLEAVDVSLGGIRLVAPSVLDSGDVVQLTLPDEEGGFGVRGLVVTSRPCEARPECCQAHVAFTGLTPRARQRVQRLIEICLASGG